MAGTQDERRPIAPRDRTKPVREENIMATTATDPVCGMTVDTANPGATAEFQGQTYYFCSTACQLKFEQEPTAYLPAG